MAKLFHISRAGQEIGRFTLPDLEKAIRLGKIHPTDYCWSEDMSGWEAVSAVLPSVSAPAQPPPAPAAPAAPASRAPQARSRDFFGPNDGICPNCGVRGAMNRFKDSTLIPRGSLSYWIALAVCFPVSVLYYFHIEQKHKQSSSCASCGCGSLVSLSSPLGRDLLAKSRK